MDHAILTRFNLPSRGAESHVRASAGWLTERVELFQRYCLPSVLAQTDNRSKWIIYFDPESPAWLRERIERHASAGYYRPVFRAEVSSSELVADISELFDTKSLELLTTNLDNDDALAADFVERLCARPRPEAATAYYLTNGLIVSPDGLYRHRDRHNAFPSMRERWDSPRTCWLDWHNRLGRHVAVVELGGAPGWLQVVHGRNVSNRTRGVLVSPSSYRSMFPGLIDDVPPPDTGALVRDRLVGRPRRVVQELGRGAAKTAVLKLLGPDGLERAKERRAARGRGRAWSSR